MKKIKIDNVEYSCPTSWDDVTLKQQIQVSKVSDSIENESLKKIAILSGYANIPYEVLKKTKLSELNDLFKHIKFINKPLPTTPITDFEFRGEHFYVGQVLIEIEFQDYISIENILQQYKDNTYEALPTVIAVMAKRKKADGSFESLDDYDVVDRAKQFENLPLTTANRMSVFFYNNEKLSQIALKLYSNPSLLVEMRINEVLNILKQSDGKGWLTKCAYGILRIYIKFIRRKLLKHFTSTQVK